MGCWKDDTVADNIIRKVADMVRSGKGTKCKLTLSSDGMKVVTSSIMSGKELKDRELFSNIYFVTVNQYNPQCLLFIAKDAKRRYRIVAIRCGSSADAGLFVSCFKDLRRAIKSNGVENNLELKQIESGNWTLRAKHPANDKRKLNTIVEMNGEAMNVHLKQNGVVKHKRAELKSPINISVEPVINNDKKHVSYVERKDANNVAIQAQMPEGNSDEFSNSISENGLREELDDLSHELREIKTMLEKSAGISADVYLDKDKKEVEFEGGNSRAKVNGITSQMDAIILDADSDENEEKIKNNILNEKNNDMNESKGQESVNSDESEVRVVVPDYRSRSSGTQTAPKYVRKYTPKEPHTPINNSHNGNVEPNSPRLSTTSYDTWKDDVVLRGKISPRTPRPRTAYMSTSSTGSSLRDRNPHVIYTTTSRTHHLMPHHSLRVPMRKSVNLSSTIERPIEKVYPRPKTVHGSIVYRPVGSDQRGTIYAMPTQKIYIDKNHNKIETNGHRLSGSIIQTKRNSGDEVVIIKT